MNTHTGPALLPVSHSSFYVGDPSDDDSDDADEEAGEDADTPEVQPPIGTDTEGDDNEAQGDTT